ncbi:MAG TPA: lysophospholipase [Anaerolineales bacterium]|nr:lysophospholipase [Anaerolineales bacterium]
MKSFESKFEGNNGISFYIRGWDPTNNRPKALLSLIHGLGEHTGRYLHVGKSMTDAGYALVGFDLRGHGKSGGARGHFPSLNAVTQDMRQFSKFLVQRYPDIPHFLYGHSLGGLLSLAYALQYPAGLNGVIVTGAALRSSLQEQKNKIAMVNLLGSVLPHITVPSGLDAATISRDEVVVKKYTNDPLVHDKTSLGLGKAALKAIEHCFSHAKEFTPPLLIMHGADDKLTYPNGSEDFAKLAEPNHDVTLKLWKGLYHEIHNEPEKAEVFKVMVDWIEKHVK